MSSTEHFTLNNGNKIPAISIFGTGTAWFKTTDDREPDESLIANLNHVLSLPGVVHIDAAEVYRTYKELSVALKATSKPRSEIWITDKYSNIAANPKVALEKSLEILGIEYVDLYLLHNPFLSKDKHPFLDIPGAWKYMEELVEAGKVKNIGVSNFSSDHLDELLKAAKIKPVVNQIEFSPFLQNQTPGIYKYAKEHDILLEAYSPLGPLTARKIASKEGEFYDYVKSLADKYQLDQSIVLLRWVYQLGVLPITTSSKNDRIDKAHTQVWSFKLEAEEVERITELGAKHPTVRQYWTDVYSKYD